MSGRRHPPPKPGGLGAKPERNLAIWRCRKAGDTYASIASVFGVSIERIRQIVAKIDRANAAKDAAP